MNSIFQRLKRGPVATVLGLAAGYILAGMPHSLSPTKGIAYAQLTADATNWEYKTTSIDSASLQTTLTALGADGWDVFSVTTSDASVETGPDGKAHMTTQRFEVIAKRKQR